VKRVFSGYLLVSCFRDIWQEAYICHQYDGKCPLKGYCQLTSMSNVIYSYQIFTVAAAVASRAMNGGVFLSMRLLTAVGGSSTMAIGAGTLAVCRPPCGLFYGTFR
jgi:hypothetical protein